MKSFESKSRQKLVKEMFCALQTEYPELVKIRYIDPWEFDGFWKAFCETFWKKKDINKKNLSSEQMAKIKAVEIVVKEQLLNPDFEEPKDILISINELDEKIAENLLNYCLAQNKIKDVLAQNIYFFEYDPVVQSFFKNKGVGIETTRRLSINDRAKLQVILNKTTKLYEHIKTEAIEKLSNEIVKFARTEGLDKLSQAQIKIIILRKGYDSSGILALLQGLVNLKLSKK